MISSGDNKQTVIFVLSVDTEEEWDWSGPFPQKDFSVDNVSRLTEFQSVCDNIGIRPTYFVDYAVADDDEAVHILKQSLLNNSCEIGAHLHPWCNPPYFGYVGEKESHVVNLPIEQVEQKLDALVQRLTKQFDVAPKSFRTGRWGIDAKVIQLLAKYDFNLDSSIYPFYQNEFFSCQGAPQHPYWADLNAPLQVAAQDKRIFELPVTAGFNHRNFALCEKLYRTMGHPLINWSRMIGVAWQTNLLRKSYLSPELFDVSQMLNLSHTSLANGTPVLHMFMHSSSLIDNNNSLVGNRDAYQYITDAITTYISQIQQHVDLDFCTISEAGAKLAANTTASGDASK